MKRTSGTRPNSRRKRHRQWQHRGTTDDAVTFDNGIYLVTPVPFLPRLRRIHHLDKYTTRSRSTAAETRTETPTTLTTPRTITNDDNNNQRHDPRDTSRTSPPSSSAVLLRKVVFPLATTSEPLNARIAPPLLPDALSVKSVVPSVLMKHECSRFTAPALRLAFHEIENLS